MRIPGVKGYLRKPSVRLGLVIAVLLTAFLALRVFRSSSNEAASDATAADVAGLPVAAPQSEPVGVDPPLTLDALGAPDDPLPAPFEILTTSEIVQSDAGADALARQIVQGRADLMPALVTALQASGIGIVGPENVVVTKPVEPWQGIVMQRWEVRLAAAMVLPERSVTLTLPDLAAVLAAAIPELERAPVERLIVADLRALAESPVPTRRFFGRFVAALGRHAVSHAPYDLLAEVNPQSIQLDGLQASLVLRRLALDMLMLAGDSTGQGSAPVKTTASAWDTVGEWLTPTIHAQGQTPCAMSERTQRIMDIAAFGSSMLWGGFEVGAIAMPNIASALEGAGIRGATSYGRLAPIASTLLAYAQFMSTYAALEAEVTLDDAPLVRTKKQSPQTGERKELTAVVRMNIGNAEMLNCFRAMLIAVGLDFSLPNNGPVKGASVSWYGVEGFDQAAAALHGGSEAIVQFVAPEASRVQGSGSAGASPITNAITGEDGKVQIGVEGRGQRRDLSEDATQVPKSAKLRLQVALKGADLFGDLQEAAGTAAGGLVGLLTVPLSMLSRAQWASVGHYTFPVTDWRDGPGRWTGTITQTHTEITARASEGPDAGGSSQETRTEIVEIEVTDTTDEQSSGGIGVMATLLGRATGKTNSQQTSSGWYSKSCGNGPKIRMTGSGRTFSSGTAAAESTITVSVGDNGSYAVLASTASLKAMVTGESSSVSQRLTVQCAIESVSESRPHVPSEMLLASGSIGATGTVDPRQPYVLQGSKTVDTPLQSIDSQTTRKSALTTTWNLRRN